MTGATSMCMHSRVSAHMCVQTRSSDGEGMGRNGLRKRGRVRMALGICGSGGKVRLVFPEKGARLSHQWTASGLSRSPL